MNHMIDDYLREVESSLRVDAARKRQIVDELRTHLTEKVADLSAADPQRSREDVAQEVLREFGNPRDLALAYGPEGAALLTNAAGDIVLRLGQAVGRGAAAVGRESARAVKWVAIALATLLVLAIGAGAWAYYEVKPYIPAIIEQSEPTYQYHERCVATPCSGSAPAHTFHVRAEATTVRLDVDVYSVHADGDRDTHLGNGSVRLTITDPTGAVRYDRAINASDEGRSHHETSWTAIEGDWHIEYVFDGFVGAVDVETFAILFPWVDR